MAPNLELGKYSHFYDGAAVRFVEHWSFQASSHYRETKQTNLSENLITLTRRVHFICNYNVFQIIEAVHLCFQPNLNNTRAPSLCNHISVLLFDWLAKISSSVGRSNRSHTLRNSTPEAKTIKHGRNSPHGLERQNSRRKKCVRSTRMPRPAQVPWYPSQLTSVANGHDENSAPPRRGIITRRRWTINGTNRTARPLFRLVDYRVWQTSVNQHLGEIHCNASFFSSGRQGFHLFLLFFEVFIHLYDEFFNNSITFYWYLR